MTTCWSRERANLLERVAPSFCGGDGLRVEEGDVATLITDPTTRECITDRLECDAESAACRGLGQYLAMVERPHRGRLMAFESAVESWPDIQDAGGGLPALGVWRGTADGIYDRSIGQRVERPTDRRPTHTVVTWTDLTLTLAVEAWCTDKEERVGIRLLVEEALMPVHWLYGARLALPFYGGRHVEYTIETGSFQDDPNLIDAGIRRVVFGVRVVMPVWRPMRLPEAQIDARGTVVDAGSAPVAARTLSIR